MDSRISNTLAKLKAISSTEKSHNPIAVTSDDLIALISAIEGAIPSLDLLEDKLKQGARIDLQDNQVHLFAKSGDAIASGNSLREMLVNLIFIEC